MATGRHWEEDWQEQEEETVEHKLPAAPDTFASHPQQVGRVVAIGTMSSAKGAIPLLADQ